MELTEKMYIDLEDLECQFEKVEDLFNFIKEECFDKLITFSNQECTDVTENIGSGWRSFQSIFNIVNTYFPGTSIEEVAYFATRKFYSIFCPDIEKVVFIPNGLDIGIDTDYLNFREYDDASSGEMGLDDYSYNILFNLGTEFENKLKEDGKLSKVIL